MRSSRKQTSDTAEAPPRKRVRLSPEVRRQQILDAALVEFSTLGFTAASIAKIARRAGTSKANLYVHFSNKDEIFETLLRDLLVPSRALLQQARQGQNLDELIDAFIDEAYAGLTPQVIAVIRLLIAESHRVPHLIQRWHEETVVPARAEQQRRIEQYVAAGQMPQTPVTDYFSFVMAPVLYVAVCRMVFHQDVAESEYRNIRETHRKVLHLLLKPQPEGPARAAGGTRSRKPG
ncbi:TetR/AcrR family transcriptional regulator [Ralstonia pseudosolanacearum]|uniref:TetR/AcrR family transcriptional regulator n=1 Tax=Ralstonia pseudosolanacearum TaxID=1310165 RepID=UPI0018D1EF84|nr:TetR/AcrR family transcriptional regulator [Ralstonia pseudosolanacearum]